jgi:uncharacterized protein (TIGR02147 family)
LSRYYDIRAIILPMSITPFSFRDYRDYLRAVIEKSPRSWGMVTRLAEASGCQRSYLSKALAGHVHLTPDHLFGITVFLKLTEHEADYLLNLLDSSRAASSAFKKRLLAKCSKMRAEYEDLQNRVQRPQAVANEPEQIYYSSWVYSALHILVSIPRYGTSRAIAEKLQLPLELVEIRLRELKNWGFVSSQDGKWKFGSIELHIPKRSPLSAYHHQNWRQRAVLDAQDPNSSGIHFTVVQSIDGATWEKIKGALIEFIENAAIVAGPSKEERLICLNADFFEV